MPDIDKSLEKFYELPPQVILTVDSEAVARRMDQINKKYSINISQLVIFVFSDDLEIDKIPQYLKRELSLDQKTADKVSEEFKQKILDPVSERLYFLDPNPIKKTIDIERVKEILRHIFEKKLKKELRKHSIIRYCVNRQVFYALKDSFDFKKELEKALYKNQEKISESPIELKGERAEPTVANWIKLFIESEGSEMFDNMKLSSFISSDKNAASLGEKEKKMLIKVLKTYRNIKFFPESMPSDNSDEWEILPLDQSFSRQKQDRGGQEQGDDSSYQETTGESESLTPAEKSEEDKGPSSHQQEEKEKEPGAKTTIFNKKEEASQASSNPEIKELEEQKQEYPEGSLERKAIEEEIKKIKNS